MPACVFFFGKMSEQNRHCKKNGAGGIQTTFVLREFLKQRFVNKKQSSRIWNDNIAKTVELQINLAESAICQSKERKNLLSFFLEVLFSAKVEALIIDKQKEVDQESEIGLVHFHASEISEKVLYV